MPFAGDNRVGLTTTLPIEVLLAAGLRPVDLNNLFVRGKDPAADVAAAEWAGFPRTTCAWIKGLYAVARREGFRRVAVVTGGDCSNAVALGEVLADEGVDVATFAYPSRPDAGALARAVEELADRFGTTAAAAEREYERLRPVRALLAEVDELTWRRDGGVTGRENFDWLVSSSDLDGDADGFLTRLTSFAAAARTRAPKPTAVRLGVVGVPPINADFFEAIAALGGDVVFNEVPRQFAALAGDTLADAYTRYTYPYDVAGRWSDVAAEVRRRDAVGVVHYVQSFCHRGIQDILLRKRLSVPILTLEGEAPGPLSAQQLLRLETFIAVL